MNTPTTTGGREQRVDQPAAAVDDRARRRGRAEHVRAGRQGHADRDAHHHVHRRHVDDATADAEQPGERPGDNAR